MSRFFHRVQYSFHSTWLQVAVSFGLVPVAFNAGAAFGAETITLTYGAIERSISVDSLEAYANSGEIPKDLRPYIRYFNPQQLQNLRQLLTAQADLSPVAVSQFLYTEQGEILLRRFGEVIRTESNLSGFYAIRSAVILAAADPQGLTVLNVLEKFPLERVRVDLSRTLQIVSDLQDLIRKTQEAIALIEELSAVESSSVSLLDFSTLMDLQEPGEFVWQKQTITLTDTERDRTFPSDIYLPETKDGQPLFSAPLIVISHGLGSDRSTYAYLAEHLASYGFAVAVPEHPGSSSRQLQALISGVANQVTSPTEFVDRPLDIQYLLDTLDDLSQTDPTFAGRVEVQHVGVIGQSLGGYTALALAGAPINFQQLLIDCTDDTLNLSLLLQCRALDLAQPIPNFRDERVKAVVAINPIGSSLLGPEGYGAIEIPVMIISSSADTVAPALPEQIRPYTWLQTPEKYLVVLEGGTHFSVIDVPNPEGAASGELVPLPSQVVGPDPEIAHTYIKNFGLAFFGTYVADDQEFQPYLTPTYANITSQNEMPISLVRSLTATQLAQALGEELIEEPEFPEANAEHRNFQVPRAFSYP